MQKEKKHDVTELNKYDKKVLAKYTSRYTNYIESGSASKDLPDEENYNSLKKR